jgi:hypothetical protein
MNLYSQLVIAFLVTCLKLATFLSFVLVFLSLLVLVAPVVVAVPLTMVTMVVMMAMVQMMVIMMLAVIMARMMDVLTLAGHLLIVAIFTVTSATSKPFAPVMLSQLGGESLILPLRIFGEPANSLASVKW